MKISELTLTVNRSGSLKIPAAVLREMGLAPNSHVRLAYLTHDGYTNTFQEFFLSADKFDEPVGDEYFSVPTHLLQKANIPPNADLQIVCLHGCLVICQDTALQPEELFAVLDSLHIADELTCALSDDAGQALQQLEDALQTAQEQKGEN